MGTTSPFFGSDASDKEERSNIIEVDEFQRIL